MLRDTQDGGQRMLHLVNALRIAPAGSAIELLGQDHGADGVALQLSL